MLVLWALFFWWPAADAGFSSVEQSLAQGQYRAALQQLSSIQPVSARWHLLASKAWDGLNDPAAAVREAEEAVRLDPQKPAYRVQLAQIFLSRNTPQPAAEILTEAQALFPDDFMIRLGRGLAEKELQRYEDAEASLRWCLARQPESALVFDALATVYLHQLRFADLRRLASGFLQQNATDFRGYYFLAAGRDGDLMPDAETLALLQKAIDRNPAFAASHALMGKILLQEQKTAEAVSSLKKAVQLRPDLVQAHLNLARALRVTGDKPGSAHEFNVVRQLKAKEQEPTPSLSYHRSRL